MVLKVIFDIAQIVLFLAGIYYFGLAIFSLKTPQKVVQDGKMNTFALIVAAHNEESVIGELVKSLKELDYPKDKFKIFVVADNCTDKTAEEAQKNGALVWKRFDETARGKGYAMEFAFEKLFKLEEKYEYISIFDADNLVNSDFLLRMNSKINEGYSAVQGYLDSKNPSGNWLTFAYSMWYWLNNRMSQLARENLKLGCRLGGTGFAVRTELIQKYGWGATCLAEDTEFTLKLALNDIKVGWAHDAVVYDEKPELLGTSMNQRKRWSQGLSEVAVRYVKPLFKKGICEKSVQAFHMLMNFWGDSVYPMTMMLFGAIYIMTFFVDKDSIFYLLICSFWASPVRMILLSAFVWGNLALMILALYSDGKLDKNIMKNTPGFLIYIITWIPIGIMGFLKRNEKEWFHTPHSGKNS